MDKKSTLCNNILLTIFSYIPTSVFLLKISKLSTKIRMNLQNSELVKPKLF